MSNLAVSLGYRLCQAEKRITELEDTVEALRVSEATLNRAIASEVELRNEVYTGRVAIAEARADTATRALADLREAAGSVLFHQLCCLGGCHESMASMARLAKLIGFETDPATAEEIEEALVAPHDSGKTHECYVEERDTATRALADLAKIAWLAAEEDSWFGDETDITVQRAAAERHRAALSKTEGKG